ncbi:hypothetical protein [Chitinophaga sancti]|uniref:hypothetical protein n=1 Tax=Chitinophaga sancti TaxID=1004 RepID=UPI003F78E4FD
MQQVGKQEVFDFSDLTGYDGFTDEHPQLHNFSNNLQLVLQNNGILYKDDSSYGYLISSINPSHKVVESIIPDRIVLDYSLHLQYGFIPATTYTK